MNRPVESIYKAAGLIPTRAETLKGRMLNSPPKKLRQHLRNLIKRITAYRDNKTILGYLTYYYPVPDVKKSLK